MRTAGIFGGTPLYIPSPLGGAPTTGVTLSDVNGNGTLDIVWSIDGALQAIDIAGGVGAGLLASVSNGMGETLQLSYGASAQLALAATQAGLPWSSNLHLSVSVVTALGLDPGGADPVRTTTYAVRDGFWDTVERRLGGFLTTTATQVGSTPQTTLVVQTTHLAGTGMERELRGMVTLEQTSDATGKLFSQSTDTWQALAIDGLDPNQPLSLVPILIDEVGLRVEGTTAPVQTHAATTYDGEGNPSQRNDDGRVDMLGDEAITTSVYGSSQTLWVRNVLLEKSVADANGVVVESTRTLYDGSDAPLAFGSLTLGWPRLSEGWLASEQRWVALTGANYDTFGNPVDSYQNGQWRHHVYDTAGVLEQTESMQPNPNTILTWTLQWDTTLQKVTGMKAPDGVTQQASYDALGRTTGLATAGGPLEQAFSYNWSAPQPTTTSTIYDGPAGNRIVTHYFNGSGDLLYDVTRLDDTNTIVGRWRQVDMRGNRVLEARRFYSTALGFTPTVPPNAPSVVYTYDAMGRVLTQTLPNGAVRTDVYSPDGKTVTGSGFAPVTYSLDGRNRIFRTQRTIGDVLETVDGSFDPADRILSLSLQSGAVVHAFTYDTLGRLIAGRDPDIGLRTHTWTDAGWLASSTNGAGQTVTLTYDAVGRLVEQQYDDGTTYTLGYDVPRTLQTYTAGRLAWVEEPTGSLVLGYDNHGRRNLAQRSIEGLTAFEAYEYSPAGLVMTRTSDDGVRLNYAYDLAGRLQSIGDFWQALSYNAEGDILAERFGNGLTETTTRDALSMPIAVELNQNDKTLLALSATYTPYGAISSVLDTDHTGLDHSASYSYDEAGRVVAATTAGFSFSYGYDPLQNLISRDIQGPRSLGSASGAYVYGGSGAGPRQLTQAGSLTLSYDKAGRTLGVGPRTLAYNALDRLTAITYPGQASETYAYGFDGERVRTQSSAQDERIFSEGMRQIGSTREHYVRAGDRIVAEVHMNGEPSTPASGFIEYLLVIFFIGLAVALVRWTSIGFRARQQHAWVRVTAAVLLVTLTAQCHGSCNTKPAPQVTVTHLYAHAALGAAPGLITDDLGNLVDERLYEPFGMPLNANFLVQDTGSANAPVDAITGWADHGARWEAPELARWLTPDVPTKAPSATQLEAPWDLNPYQMVRQNPLLYKDPDGHFVNILVGAAAGAVVGAGVEAATEWVQTGHLDGRRIAAHAAGGAFVGGAAAGTAGLSLIPGAAAAAAGNIIGQFGTRSLLGERTEFSAVAVDAAVGVLSFGVLRGVGKLLVGVRGAAAPVEAAPVEVAQGKTFSELDLPPQGRIIPDVKVQPLTQGGKGYGFRYRWVDAEGNKIELRGHGPDPGAPPGSNSRTGDTIRVSVNGNYADAQGRTYTRAELKENNEASNATHIPLRFEQKK